MTRAVHTAPPPPDIEPLPEPSGPVRFSPQAPGFEIVLLGSNPIGTIQQRSWGRMFRWGYRTSLFEAPLDFSAPNLHRARIKCLHRIADWHDLAGPLYAEIAKKIRMQADGMAT